MAVRKIVSINEELCDGCGDCVPSCAEGAIKIIDGKARLVADNLCDGLGACLGECPQGAITVEDREADAFDEVAVEHHLSGMSAPKSAGLSLAPKLSAPAGHGHEHGQGPGGGHGPGGGGGGGCPGSRMMHFPVAGAAAASGPNAAGQGAGGHTTESSGSELRQWPIQLHLVQPGAPYFQGADLLLAADCAAFASGEFHQRFLRGKSLAMACPKLDQGREIYLRKLIGMIDDAKINTLTVLVMEVPCCAGLLSLAQEAAAAAQRKVPVKQIIMGLQGQVLREDWC